MRLSFEISFEQLLMYVKQLSFSEKKMLVAEIQNEMVVKEEKRKPNALQELLLQGPTWTETEYKNYLRTHEQLNQFGKNDSA